MESKSLIQAEAIVRANMPRRASAEREAVA